MCFLGKAHLSLGLNQPSLEINYEKLQFYFKNYLKLLEFCWRFNVKSKDRAITVYELSLF